MSLSTYRKGLLVKNKNKYVSFMKTFLDIFDYSVHGKFGQNQRMSLVTIGLSSNALKQKQKSYRNMSW